MSLYSDYPAARARQVVGDIVGVTMSIFVIATALIVTASIRALAGFGRDLETAGEGFQSGLGDAAETLGDVPLIGGGIRAPFDAAAGAGEAVAAAGRSQQAFVEVLAVGAGWFVALAPLLILLLVWILPRARFARRSRQVRGFIAAGMTADTLAVRAIARAPLAELAAVHPDPAAAWRSQDAVAVRQFAAIELRRAGIRPNALP